MNAWMPASVYVGAVQFEGDAEAARHVREPLLSVACWASGSNWLPGQVNHWCLLHESSHFPSSTTSLGIEEGAPHPRGMPARGAASRVDVSAACARVSIPEAIRAADEIWRVLAIQFAVSWAHLSLMVHCVAIPVCRCG